MDELSVGDSVLTAGKRYNSILMFTHKTSNLSYRFYEERTQSGHAVSCTSGHYLMINGGMKAASEVKKGDTMVLDDGTETAVDAIKTNVFRKGLNNPITVSGEIFVDGLLASTYTTAVEPASSHAILAPVRKIFQWFGFDASFGGLEGGFPIKGIDTLLPSGKNEAV